MESLSETPWDITISGTGLPQSLLALALSRSGKKILHVDKNRLYGGTEAAFSLQEAEEWVNKLEQEPGTAPFEDVSIYVSPEHVKALSFSRAYTLSLSPHLVYSRSKLLPCLVSSKVYRQLEFQPVGSWWIYKSPNATRTSEVIAEGDASECLHRVPNSREDIFADLSIPVKSKRALIKFLRHIAQPLQQDVNNTPVDLEDDLDLSFAEYLISRFQVPSELHDPLLSLSLAPVSPQQTLASFAVPRIKRHLGSIGVFGRGFGSVLTKWGGGSEISQVGCRALAVGGGVYVLNRGIQSIDIKVDLQKGGPLQLQLSDGEVIRTKFVVGSHWDLPPNAQIPQPACHKVARSINIVSSSLAGLFPVMYDGGPTPTGVVVVVPGTELTHDQGSAHVPYLLVHSSETGECPSGQCIIYGMVSLPGSKGQSLIEEALNKLLRAFTDADGTPAVLWSLRYTQLGLPCGTGYSEGNPFTSPISDRIICFQPSSLDIAFDDGMIDAVKAAWKRLSGDDTRDEEFMNFEDRAGVFSDDE